MLGPIHVWLIGTHIHTHEHIGTVGMETKHSKTPSNHLMTTESERPSRYKEFVLLKRVLVVQRRCCAVGLPFRPPHRLLLSLFSELLPVSL